MICAIIVAGGKGSRMGAGFNKVFIRLGGKTVIERTVEVFNRCDAVDEIVLVTSENDIGDMQKIIDSDIFPKVKNICKGGERRQDSVYNGLLKTDADIVLIHDGARCLITENEILRIIDDVKTYNAAAIGVAVKDTLKTIDDSGNIVSTVDREKTVQIQTPQAFYADEIIELHKRAQNENITVTDDSSLFEHYGKTVHFTSGSYDNIKLTTPEDIAIGEEILRRRGDL